ncbi:hypothetical protein CLPU_10c00050 [Gottschalkia purinilytica]|uniref:UPF0178 protein CLPU_10c00050 n=1 Tax=Gottschalkia purinilytica TaxID=1503 RepID=A0A0L0W923_GOTPU|nr:YaiI/YqxD family protein [Gottschalkia purinilytica]KNF07951.1 hypothetical protein CLPU_10c00050 [Gottschalkia purinilytica]
MKILVDADGCPVVKLAVRIAQEYNLDIMLVKNYSHNIDDPYATIITVDKSRDSADFYIVNKSEKNDIIVTQDYGLAAMALSKGALCINQNGFIISSRNIDGLLARRHFNQELRRKHKQYSKFKKRNPLADQQFEKNFKALIEEYL